MQLSQGYEAEYAALLRAIADVGALKNSELALFWPKVGLKYAGELLLIVRQRWPPQSTHAYPLEMDNPFKPKTDPMVAIAHAAMPVLLDKLGGSATVSVIELAQLSERYGGAVAVKATEQQKGVYRLTLVPAKPKPVPGAPTS
jgi:hypothetical protein